MRDCYRSPSGKCTTIDSGSSRYYTFEGKSFHRKPLLNPVSLRPWTKIIPREYC